MRLKRFVQKTVVAQGQRIATADVWLGEFGQVDLVAANDRSMLIPALEQDGISAEARYVSPLQAPISEGEEVGTLVISMAGLPDAELPLVAARSVPKGGFVPRIKTAASVLMARALDRASDDGGAEPATE